MAQPPRRHIGRITTTDLSALCTAHGLDGLPYPFAPTPPNDLTHRDSAGTATETAQQSDNGALRDWIQDYLSADIWVTSRTHHSEPDTPDHRILAHRAGDIGYLAIQSADDSIEIHTLNAHDLGPAVAHQVRLTQPGQHRQVVVNRYIDYFTQPAANRFDDLDCDLDDPAFTVSVQVRTTPPQQQRHPTISDDDITAVTTIQSRWQPARTWGTDWSQTAIVLITATDDGDYVYTADYTHATPTDHQTLTARINQLITEDITAIRHHRGITR